MTGVQLRIGELSKRVGVSPEALRAWEARYQVVRPKRSAGGLRLYTERDEARLRLMVAHIADGLPASEAARLAKLVDPQRPREAPASLADIRAGLEQSFDTFDEPLAQATLDRLMSTVVLEQAIAHVILPFLHSLGERWATGQTTPAHEHFASSVIGGRLRALARGWGDGIGPVAVLACPPGELHELGLICFGLALRERGWRIVYLGAQTPIDELARASRTLSAAAVVLAATTRERFLECAPAIEALTRSGRVYIGGAGAGGRLAEELGVGLLEPDLLAAAAALKP